ncbi:DUF2191 domain-containing protein [Nocardioides sp. W7]|uniref:DUF2191 domain-containing protein n=1 Tax=Nocardioides sp. W7 TaxID=2931390 RepID=UPI001FD1B120|nr:DUF2191 domain-containing protein [Nocardioides sp. W7]
MRTTLTIDDRVLAAARSRAQRRGISVGDALSELALIGYETETSAVAPPAGFPMLAPVAGHVITVEMVDDALAEE